MPPTFFYLVQPLVFNNKTTNFDYHSFPVILLFQRARHLSHDFVALRNDNNTRDQECGVSAGKKPLPTTFDPTCRSRDPPFFNSTLNYYLCNI